MHIKTMLLAAALIAIGSSAMAQSAKETARREIQAQYDRWEPVAKSLDAGKIHAFLVDVFRPELRFVGEDGRTLNKAQWIEGLGAFTKTFKKVDRWKYQIRDVALSGRNGASVKATSSFRYSFADEQGRLHLVAGTQQVGAQWTRGAGRWQIGEWTDGPTSQTIDGNPDTSDLEAVKAGLLDNYRRAVEAYRMRDAEAYAALFAPDFRGTTYDGKSISGRSAVASWAKGDMAITEAVRSAEPRIERLEAKGNTATWIVTEVWDQTMLDPDGIYGPAGRSYDCVWKQRSRATFVKTPQGWLLKTGHYLTPVDLRVDGKPLVPLSKRSAKN